MSLINNKHQRATMPPSQLRANYLHLSGAEAIGSYNRSPPAIVCLWRQSATIALRGLPYNCSRPETIRADISVLQPASAVRAQERHRFCFSPWTYLTRKTQKSQQWRDFVAKGALTHARIRVVDAIFSASPVCSTTSGNAA